MHLRQYVLGFALALAVVPAQAAAIDGKWKTTVDAGPQGRVELVFDLKATGKKLDGTLSGPILPAPAPLVDGVVDGNQVSFALTMAIVQGMPPVLISYSGRVQGDELTLAATVDMGQGPIVTPVVARRDK